MLHLEILYFINKHHTIIWIGSSSNHWYKDHQKLDELDKSNLPNKWLGRKEKKLTRDQNSSLLFFWKIISQDFKVLLTQCEKCDIKWSKSECLITPNLPVSRLPWNYDQLWEIVLTNLTSLLRIILPIPIPRNDGITWETLKHNYKYIYMLTI